MLRSLPKWQSTGRWQSSGSGLNRAQKQRRMLQLERARFEAEDFRSVQTAWQCHGLPELIASRMGCREPSNKDVLRQISVEVQAVIDAYPDRPLQKMQYIHACGWSQKVHPISLTILSGCAGFRGWYPRQHTGPECFSPGGRSVIRLDAMFSIVFSATRAAQSRGSVERGRGRSRRRRRKRRGRRRRGTIGEGSGAFAASSITVSGSSAACGGPRAFLECSRGRVREVSGIFGTNLIVWGQ